MPFKDDVEKMKALGSRLQKLGLPWFRKEDYTELRKLFVDRDNVFDTFEEWETAPTLKERELKANGAPAVRVIVTPKDFGAWCTGTGCKPDGQSRANYAAQKALVSISRQNSERLLSIVPNERAQVTEDLSIRLGDSLHQIQRSNGKGPRTCHLPCE